MLPHITQTKDRIRHSEKFLRITEAEKSIGEYNIAWKARRDEAKLKKKEPSKHRSQDNQVAYEDDSPNHYFNSFVVNDDPKLSQYLPFDEVIYPRAFDAAKLPPSSIEKLWVVGFLDRAERDADKIKASKVKELKDAYSESASCKDDKSSAIGKSKSKSRTSSNTANSINKNSFVESEPVPLLRSDSVHSSHELSSCGVGTIFTRPDSINSQSSRPRQLQPLGSVNTGSSSSANSFAPPAVHSRTAAKLVNNMSRATTQQQANSIMRQYEIENQFEPSFLQQPLAQRFKPYQDVIEGHEMAQRKIRPKTTQEFASHELDQVFDIEQREHEAAKVMQRAWRRTWKLLPWRRATKCLLMAVRIQRMVRGNIARRWVAQWYHSRTLITITWQSLVRKYLSNKHDKIQKLHEKRMVIKIQRIIRGKLGRIRWRLSIHNLCATRIQAMWRGISARSLSDRLWLDRRVVPIQRMVRGMCARRRSRLVKSELNVAANSIQKQFRAWLSRKRLGEALYRREMSYRMNTITVLTSEEECVTESLDKFRVRFMKNHLKDKAEAGMKDLHHKDETIHQQQNDLTELGRQQEILSPRAIQQGWYGTLNKNLFDKRKELTAAKIQFLFHDTIAMQRMDDQLELQVRKIEQVAAQRDQLGKWRDLEYQERRESTYTRDVQARVKARRQAVADERRKWQVVFHTKNGKPDKRRRPGRRWDAAMYAGPEKATYCGATGVDLLANVRKLKDGKKSEKPTVNSRMDETMTKMTLQTYLDQVNHYEQLMNPLADIMKNFMGGPPDLNKPHPQELGFGPAGEDLAPAMWGIGAVPASWQPVEEEEEYLDEDEGATLRGGGNLDAATTLSSSNAHTAQSTLTQSVTDKYPVLSGIDGDNMDDDNASDISFTSPRSQQQHQQPKNRNNNSNHNNNSNSSTSSNSRYDEILSRSRSSYSRSRVNREQLREQERLHLLECEQALRDAQAAERKAKFDKRRQLRKDQRRSGVIPWELLDKLDGEKQRFENEKSFVEFHCKF